MILGHLVHKMGIIQFHSDSTVMCVFVYQGAFEMLLVQVMTFRSRDMDFFEFSTLTDLIFGVLQGIDSYNSLFESPNHLKFGCVYLLTTGNMTLCWSLLKIPHFISYRGLLCQYQMA